MRATIVSTESMFISLALGLFFPLAGFLVDKISAKYIISISSLLAIPMIILYLKIKEFKENVKSD